MGEKKTKATKVTVESYLSTITDDSRREDCQALATLMAKATRETATMWGPSIVGFGSYHYEYVSGREGDSCLVGFSSRKGDISIYLAGNFPGRDELLAKLGKHKTAKACLYIRKMSDVDVNVLEKMIVASFVDKKKNHGEP